MNQISGNYAQRTWRKYNPADVSNFKVRLILIMNNMNKLRTEDVQKGFYFQN